MNSTFPRSPRGWILCLVSLLASVGCAPQETRLKVSDNESVYFSADVSEVQARALAHKLKRIGFFNGANEKDVFLRKGPNGREVSFIVQEGVWNDPSVVAAFASIGRQIATTVGGPPCRVALLDAQRRPQKELTIEIADIAVEITPVEKIFRDQHVSEEQARQLGQSLLDVGFFDGNAERDVLFRKQQDKYIVMFVVHQDTWNDPDVIAAFERIAQSAASTLGLPTLELQLIDDDFQTHYTVQVSAAANA